MNTASGHVTALARSVLPAMVMAGLLLVGCAGGQGGSGGATTGGRAVNPDVDIRNRGVESETRRRARLRMELASGYFENGQYAVALDEMKRALAIDPDYAEAIGVLALIYSALNEKGLAEENFQRALRLKPEDSDITNNYGWFLCQNGRPAQAIPYFQTAMRNPLYQRPALPLQNAGLCSMQLGDRKAAEDYFMRSFQLDPSGAIAAHNLAEINFERNDLERARFYANQVNRGPAVNPASLWLGIKIERKSRNRSEELLLADRLRRLFPQSREAQALTRGAYNE